MKRRINYTDEPLGKLRVIPDFLPSPEELARHDEGVKVTMTLSKASVDFFKKAAKASRTPYQRMIRRLIDIYVSGAGGRQASRS